MNPADHSSPGDGVERPFHISRHDTELVVGSFSDVPRVAVILSSPRVPRFGWAPEFCRIYYENATPMLDYAVGPDLPYLQMSLAELLECIADAIDRLGEVRPKDSGASELRAAAARMKGS